MNWFEKLHETFIVDNRYMWMLEGLGNTLIITFGALLIGVVIGTLVAVAKYYAEGNKKLRFVSWLCDLYTTVIRGIPMTVLLLLFFFVLFVSARNGVPVAIAAFGINSGAYMAELIRSGINAVDKGQMEAARSLGLSYWRSMFRVVLPQAIKNMIPSIVNQFIITLKDTSILSVIGFPELVNKAQNVIAITFKSFQTWAIVAVMYLVVILSLQQIANALERRLNRGRKL
jgi:His/Glu/Gln/Arg/opine family amino acid ABC transporter permease subunit